MALLNRFSRLNDRGETGIFTFIVTKSVTRDAHRDATTKDFCFGYHRWAVSFQRPSEKMLGVHLLLRNASPNTACVVDFTLTLLNREHFSQNQVYTKKQAKFTITNPMQGVSRWIELSELVERKFSNETGEFLFELSLSNMTTIFECDIQLSSAILSQYKQMLRQAANGANSNQPSSLNNNGARRTETNRSNSISSTSDNSSTSSRLAAKADKKLQHGGQAAAASQQQQQQANSNHQQQQQQQLINLETNCFTFGAFEWSLTIVPLVLAGGSSASAAACCSHQTSASQTGTNATSSSSSPSAYLSPTNGQQQQNRIKQQQKLTSKRNNNMEQTMNNNNNQQFNEEDKFEPVCRVYLNRLNGFDSLCRVKYRVILGHHQTSGPNLHSTSQSAAFVDSKQLDQISDCDGRIRGYQFRQTNIMKLISLRSHNSTSSSLAHQSIGLHHHQVGLYSSFSSTIASGVGPNSCSSAGAGRSHAHHHHAGGGRHAHHQQGPAGGQHHAQHNHGHHHHQQQTGAGHASVDLRVHIEMFCANTISEATVPLRKKSTSAAQDMQQVANCSDRNKQSWCIEADNESGDTLKLKLFFMDLQSVPRNHIRYISWIAYLVRRDPKTGHQKDSVAVKNWPHSNYYLQDGIDMGTIMDTDLKVKELNKSPDNYLAPGDQLTVHIEWVDSLLLFSHLYNNYDALATIQRHQISRELDALQQEVDYLERKYVQVSRALNRLGSAAASSSAPAGGNGSGKGSGSGSGVQQLQLGAAQGRAREQLAAVARSAAPTSSTASSGASSSAGSAAETESASEPDEELGGVPEVVEPSRVNGRSASSAACVGPSGEAPEVRAGGRSSAGGATTGALGGGLGGLGGLGGVPGDFRAGAGELLGGGLAVGGRSSSWSLPGAAGSAVGALQPTTRRRLPREPPGAQRHLSTDAGGAPHTVAGPPPWQRAAADEQLALGAPQAPTAHPHGLAAPPPFEPPARRTSDSAGLLGGTRGPPSLVLGELAPSYFLRPLEPAGQLRASPGLDETQVALMVGPEAAQPPGQLEAGDAASSPGSLDSPPPPPFTLAERDLERARSLSGASAPAGNEALLAARFLHAPSQRPPHLDRRSIDCHLEGTSGGRASGQAALLGLQQRPFASSLLASQPAAFADQSGRGSSAERLFELAQLASSGQPPVASALHLSPRHRLELAGSLGQHYAKPAAFQHQPEAPMLPGRHTDSPHANFLHYGHQDAG